ncbi:MULTISPECIES: integrating conjugative element protein [Steroidobacteraceae]|nr:MULTISPECIES: integrating conjugative element protein [Steroidobacteraceae]
MITPLSVHHAIRLAVVSGLLLSSSALLAQTVIDEDVRIHGSVIDDHVLYTIGGGSAVSMSRAPGMQSYGAGIGWNANLICGDMSLEVTLRNQLNGITDGFQAIMSDIIESATAAVASLPALIIQRADPGLYNLLTNGILQARLDYDRSKLTCRQIADRMAEVAGGQLGWDQLAEGLALRDAVASTDAVSAIEAAENNRGNNGVTWIGGQDAGGAGQEPIGVVGDIARAGYNLLNGRGITDTSPIDPNACNGRLSCAAWPSPDAAAAWAIRVLGETQHRTCDTCTKTQATAGVGLTPLIQEEYERKLQALQGLVTGAQALTIENLVAAGSTAMPITRGVIEALRDEPDQNLLAHRLASEIALAAVLERALLLQRLLLAGAKEPNVASNRLAQDAISRETEWLAREIESLRTELEVRRTLASNAPMAIIERHSGRSDASRGVFQGDRPDRLEQIQRAGGGGQN